MTEVTVRDLRNKGGEILKQVEAGRSFVVTRDGEPVAELHPLDRHTLSREAIIERFKHVPLVDATRLRHDIDSFIDQTI
jgi:prevent-host-death family protein